MGALFGFVVFWLVVALLMLVAETIQIIGERVRGSGWFALVILGICEGIRCVENFFTLLFSNAKKLVYKCQDEWREIKWNMQKRGR